MLYQVLLYRAEGCTCFSEGQLSGYIHSVCPMAPITFISMLSYSPRIWPLIVADMALDLQYSLLYEKQLISLSRTPLLIELGLYSKINFGYTQLL